MLYPLEQSILSAIIYFDMFDYPLTLVDLHRFLYKPEYPYTLGEVSRELENSESLFKIVHSQHGFFYLFGREEIVRTRQQRYSLSASKWRRAKRVAKFLSHIPFVRMVGISGSLAYHNSRVESDIDLLIITKRKGVWWARFMALTILHLLRLRPGQGGTANKICLSLFADEENLDFHRLLINKDDIDFVFWLANIYPVYDSNNYYQKFWQANNWIKDWLPNTRPPALHLLPSKLSCSSFRRCIEWLLLPFNFMARGLQEQAFPNVIRELLNKDTRVRVESGLLKFHTTDRRQKYQDKYRARLNGFVV